MNEEEQFVNIDLNDDNICSICKLETDTGTLSFCHICFELSIEGIPRSRLLHTKSLRGHRECFEKYHLIANQELPRAKVSKSTYEEVKNVLSRKIGWIVQYAQNKDLDSDQCYAKGHMKSEHQLLRVDRADQNLLPRLGSQVPRYSPRWMDETVGALSSQQTLEDRLANDFGLQMLKDSSANFHSSNLLWPSPDKAQRTEDAIAELRSNRKRHKCHTREDLNSMRIRELEQLSEKFLQQIQEVFEELTQQLQEKDSLASELHVRHIAIEQLFKNRSKLPWLQVGRAKIKASIPLNK
ncbi:LOW QUALITY PROTEIN: protein EURL homolog [Latimeria chalumnae]|uniref:LOW QUALITY PROTEIN: protein EURL homolog n=1 Tax=Latimeria chalumnae TaxID=7897 RepID=UPI0003C131FA